MHDIIIINHNFFMNIFNSLLRFLEQTACSLLHRYYYWISESLDFPVVPKDPCLPSPCGMYAECRNNNGIASCSCLPSYRGSPPNCRPECRVNSECPMNLACNNEKCRDVCLGSCGITSLCTVYNHIPVCTCPEGFIGDPFSNCYPRPVTSKKFLYLLLRKSCLEKSLVNYDAPFLKSFIYINLTLDVEDYVKI